MNHLNKYAITLALLLGAATGTWAQDDITVTKSGAQANQWQYTMPDVDVELTVNYFPTAAFSEGCEPTAIEGIIAGTDNNIVSTGQSQQGTVMYYATVDVNAPAPDYDAAGWTSTVPTANVVAFGVTENVPVNVYYYIKGQDTPEGETPTAENNFNDTEIFGPLSITLLENVAHFSEGGEPTAIQDVIAGTDNPIVSTGQSQQGTVMYYATTNVNAPAPDYDAAGWTSTVPTANVVAFGVTENVPVNVYYYIKGQDTPEGETPTAENTFTDTEIFGPLSITLLENVAHFSEGGEPTAIQDVIAGTDAALVSTGQSQQGTVMYYATTDARPTTPDYDAEGWSATVPNAIMFGDKKEDTRVFVFYYIKGNVAPEGQAATAENTFNDTEIFGPLTITMKKNLFSVALRPLTQFNADGGQATVTVDGQPTDNYSLKQGQIITVAAAEGYKIRTAKMGDAAVPVGEVTTGDLGKLVGEDGYIYADIEAVVAASAIPSAQIVYVGCNTGVEGYDRGLALHLWDFERATIPGAYCCEPSKAQWDTMIEAAGGYQALRNGLIECYGDDLYSGMSGNGHYYSTDEPLCFDFQNGKWVEDNTTMTYRFIQAIASAALSGDDATLNDTKTVATYTVPDHDATVKYLLARDLTQQVAFAGIPAEPVGLTMGPDGNYQPDTPLDIQLNDAIAGADIISAEGLTVSYEKQDGDTWTAADDFLTNMQPGTYRIVASATDEMSPYDGTLTSATFTLTDNGIRLDEAADNSPVLAKQDGQEANVSLTRTLQAGGYNTFAAPFAIGSDVLTAKGITAKVLTASAFDSKTDVLSLTFATVTSLEAGKPYLVKVGTNVENPTFEGVTISSTATTTETEAVDFIPTLGVTAITADAQSILFLSAGNRLYNPAAADSQQMKGFRAYFLLKGDAASARSFSLDFGDGETTFISEALKVKSEEFATATGWYTLDGRRIEGQPTQRSAEGRLFPQGLKKGVYIVNGKKIVIK